MAVIVAPGATGANAVDGRLAPECLTELNGLGVVALWAQAAEQARARQALAARDGAIVPLAVCRDFHDLCVWEKLVCIDTTASGGNASLLAAIEPQS